MATITVSYTPQTTGPHRIGYKQIDPVLDADYCKILDNSVSTPGVPKMFVIADAGVTVCDSGVNPSDPPGTYDGFVQPACAPDDDSTDAAAWAAPVVIP